MDLSKICIILDAGHSKNTPGKCSVDKTLYEWKWAREVRDLVIKSLAGLYVDYYDDHSADVTLGGSESADLVQRSKNTNAYIAKKSKENKKCLYISIHVNAAGNGSKWMNAKGWECYTTPGQNNSDKLAECLYDSAKKIFKNKKIRTDLSDGDSDKEANFYVLKKANCPAVLIENFFMDNKEDLEFIKSTEGKKQCAEVIVQGILNYCTKY